MRLLLPVLALAFAARLAGAQTAAFTDVTTPQMQGTQWGEGVAWGDYDNDGDLDLLVSNEGQHLELFRNDGGGVLTLATPPGLDIGGNWTGVAWGDYDNDGDIDLLAAEAERPKHLFRNDRDPIVLAARQADPQRRRRQLHRRHPARIARPAVRPRLLVGGLRQRW